MSHTNPRQLQLAEVCKSFRGSLWSSCAPLYHQSAQNSHCLRIKKKTCILLLCKDQWNLCIPPSVCVYMCLCVCVSWSGSVMLTICNRSSLFRSQSEIKIHPHVAKVSSTHHGNRSLPANECPLRPKQMLAWPLTPNTFVTVGWPLSLPSPLGWSTICHSEGDFIIPDKTSRQSVVGKCHC